MTCRISLARTVTIGGLLLLVAAQAGAWGEPALRGSVSRSGQAAPVYRSRHPRVMQGDRLAEAYKLKAAEAQYRKALRANPNDPGTHNGLGKVLVAWTTTSDQAVRDQTETIYAQAIQEFLTALRLRPGYLEARLNLAEVYLAQGRVAEAREAAWKALEQAPGDSGANEMAGRVLLAEGKPNDAVPHLRKAVQGNSKNHSAWYHLGLALTERGEYSPALEALQTSLYQYRNSAPVHAAMARVYERQGNGAAAVNSYDKALSIKPEYREAGLALARHYETRGDLDAALVELNSQWEAWPEDAEIGHRLGDLALKARRPDIARETYQRLLAWQPEDRRAREGLSQSELQAAQWEAAMTAGFGGDLESEARARAALEQSLAYDPSNYKARLYQVKLDGGSRNLAALDPRFVQATLSGAPARAAEHLNRGEVRMARLELDKAGDEFRAAVNAVATPGEIATVGDILLAMGQPALAEQAFLRARQAAPADPVAALGLQKATLARTGAQTLLAEARLYRKRENRGAALAKAQEALKKDMGNADAHRLAGELYERDRQYRDAIRHYHAFLTLAPWHPDAQGIRRRAERLAKRL